MELPKVPRLRPRAILSDADGTLVDTVGLIRHGQYETAKSYLEKQGVAAESLPSYDTYEGYLNQVVGGAARDTLERTVRLLYAHQPHHAEAFDFDALHDELNPVQDRIAPEFVKPYTGLSRFLHHLGKTGVGLAIFTSGSPHHIVRNFGIALPELGMSESYLDASIGERAKLARFESAVTDHFRIPGFTVVTCDDVAAHKPDPEGLQLALDRLDVAPDEAMVLGDHRVDMLSAVNAGVGQRVGITHGFDDETALRAAGASMVVNSLDELGRMLR